MPEARRPTLSGARGAAPHQAMVNAMARDGARASVRSTGASPVKSRANKVIR
jgi:hypothetical protein